MRQTTINEQAINCCLCYRLINQNNHKFIDKTEEEEEKRGKNYYTTIHKAAHETRENDFGVRTLK